MGRYWVELQVAGRRAVGWLAPATMVLGALSVTGRYHWLRLCYS